MNLPRSLKAAPAIAVILALTSMQAHGAPRKGGANSSDSKAAAEGTAAHSARQGGTVDSNTSAQGAERRARTGSFSIKPPATTNDAAKSTAASSTATIVEKAVAASHRKVSAHIADAEAFASQLMSLPHGQRPLGNSIVSEVKNQVLNGPTTERQLKIYAIVDQLSRTDEKALHAFFLLAMYGNADIVKAVKPEFAASIDRLKEKLNSAGISDFRVNTSGELWAPGWSISNETAQSVLAAPGARSLLHKLTDSEAQQNKREALAKERADILNVANAQGSLEMMQELKQYIKATIDAAGVDLTMPTYFMNKLTESNFPISGNGGVILAFGSGLPMEMITEYGMTSYYGGHHMPSLNQESLTRKLKEDLGLERIEVRPFPGLNRWKQFYVVTRLPDGTKIPKASQVDSIPVSPEEIKVTVWKTSEAVRGELRIEPEE